MEGRIARLESEVARLAAALARLEHQKVPRPDPMPSAPIMKPPVSGTPAGRSAEKRLPIGTVVGRGVLILGGAFILRALTERSVVAPDLGLLLGLVYAVIWLLAAARPGLGQRSRRGLGYGLASVVIIYPLLWEAANGMSLMSHSLATVVLGGYIALSLLICIRMNQRILAWINLSGSLIVCLGFFSISTAKLPVVIVMLAMMLMTWWAARKRRWPGLRWPTAFVTDSLVLMIVDRAARVEARSGNGYPDAATALWLALALAGLTFVFLSVSALIRRRGLSVFDMLQTVIALAVGLGGAVYVTTTGYGSPRLIGLLTVLLAVMSYVTAFTYVRRVAGRSVNFYYFGSLALVLMIFGSRILYTGTGLAYVWLILALLASAVSRFTGRATLGGHGAVLLCAVAIRAGTPWMAIRAPAETVGAHVLDPVNLLAVFVAIGCRILLDGEDRLGLRRILRLSKLLILILAMVGLVGLAAGLLGRLVNIEGVADAERAAVIRFFVHATAAVAVAFLHRKLSRLDVGWLAIPIAVAAGLELLLVNMRVCGSVTLAICFMGYGAALILVSRLQRTDGGVSDELPGKPLAEA